MKRPVLRMPDRVEYMHNAHRYAKDHKMRIIQVKNIYHPAHRGEKAFVHQVGCRRLDAWFQEMWPPQGTVFMVSSRIGHGPQHNRPTLYVDRYQIHDEFPPQLYRMYLQWRRGLSVRLYFALLLFLVEWIVYGLFFGIKTLYRSAEHIFSKKTEEQKETCSASEYSRIEWGCDHDGPEGGGMTIRALTASEFEKLTRRSPPEDTER